MSTALSRSNQLLPVQRTWLSQETPSEDELNQNVRDAVNFLLSPPRVSLSCGSTQSVPTTSMPLLDVFSWDTEIIDTDNMWDSGNPTKIFINTPGLYRISAYLRYPYLTPTGVSYALGMARNAGGNWPAANYPNRLADDTRPASADAGRMSSLWISIIFPFVAGDYIEVFTGQSSANDRAPDIQLNGFDARWVALS